MMTFEHTQSDATDDNWTLPQPNDLVLNRFFTMTMKAYLVTSLAFFASIAPALAQQAADTAGGQAIVPPDADAQSPLTWRAFAVQPALLAAGAVVWALPASSPLGDEKLQRHFVSSGGGHRRNKADDYLLFSPLCAALVLPAVLKTPHRSVMPELLLKSAIAEAGVLVIAEGLKKGFDKRRPNGGSLSFPSGHTAQAFMGAQLMFLEYRDTNKWLAHGGYAVAAFVGVDRVINNAHWVSDVLAGAGLGMLVPTIVYWVDGKIRCKNAASKKAKAGVMPVFLGGKRLGLAFHCQL